MAKGKGITPAQLALAWVLGRGKDIVPIPGTSSTARLEEDVAAVEVHLSAADLDRLQRTSPRGAAAGDRYSPPLQELLNR
jgi:aryl-alcohol dehydrogenase-like predicted oxidoreductase